MKPSHLIFLPFAGIIAGSYYLVQRGRVAAYKFGFLTSRKALAPIISLGNISMGGSGKTPAAIYLAAKLREIGYSPAVVSRGYKGAYRSDHLIVSDGAGKAELPAASSCGDEPLLIARKIPGIPVIVSRERISAVNAAIGLGANLIILDDGFQHLNLFRDLDIVMLTGSEDYMFPMGYLREPISALTRASIFLKRSNVRLNSRIRNTIRDSPVFDYQVECSGIRLHDDKVQPISQLESKSVLLLSGIANPDRFETTVKSSGFIVKDRIDFPDHHSFSDNDLNLALERAQDCLVVLTEKDWVKLPKWFRGLSNTAALCIELRICKEPKFMDVIKESVGAPR